MEQYLELTTQDGRVWAMAEIDYTEPYFWVGVTSGDPEGGFYEDPFERLTMDQARELRDYLNHWVV